ncbi:ATP-binding protein [Thermogemmatispora carboxidivorans]|uniref:ATP-binding protein n=1 Tax=Thermogemmatispora carboxidivorans TaxID=1382306 RepID=UPI0012DED08B|nr:ATP-binding protein [Thermogemmatispora carboxidivorans]
MERLNDIMLKQRRQQLLQQRARQAGTLPRERGEQPTRLPEQTARLNQALSHPGRSSRGRVEVTEVPGADVLSDTLTLGNGEPLSRPSRQPGRQTDRLYGSRREVPAPSLPRRTRDYYYRADDYLPSLRGDALSEEVWEEEDDDDDEGGMRYGDWEDEEELLEASSRPALSRSAVASRLPSPKRAFAPGEDAALQRRTEGPVSAPGLPRGRLALSSSGAPSPARQQRVTQPLRPNALANPAFAQLQEMLRQRPARQAPGRERPAGGPLGALGSNASASALPAPFGSQRPVCPKCKGAGYLRLDVPFGHPHFGKPIPCECKEADLKERRRQQLRSMSNLDAFRDKSFKSFNYTVPGVRQAYQTALEYTREPDGWLLLVGPNGCGKTHLAAAIANLCLENGSLVLFATVPDLLDHLRAAFAPEAPEVYDQLFARMREAELLVLDDLGAQQSSPWANEKLFQLLNYRYNLRYPTVITANPRGLQAIDERIRSRLSDASLVTMVTFEGALDYRPRNPRRN